jgi:hypothetical protein
MTAASRSLATALWKARFASGLLLKCYTTSWDTIRPECVAVKEVEKLGERPRSRGQQKGD